MSRKHKKKLAFPLTHFPLESCVPRAPVVRHGHIGVHRQRQEWLFYLGVQVPVGRMLAAQMEELADVADRHGRGELRLTVFQNLILPHVQESNVEAAREAIRTIGFQTEAGSVSGGLVACTGNAGCKYAATNTKRHAVLLGEYLQERVPLDLPINIHLTGCPHSCAQHYCGDICLLGASVSVEECAVEGYHVVLGGGMDHEQGIAREFFKAVPFDELPMLLERVLKVYLTHRHSGETFIEYTRRNEVDKLRSLLEEVAV